MSYPIQQTDQPAPAPFSDAAMIGGVIILLCVSKMPEHLRSDALAVAIAVHTNPERYAGARLQLEMLAAGEMDLPKLFAQLSKL